MALLDQLQHLQPVEPAALQPDVEKDEVGPPSRNRSQRLVGGTRLARPIALILQEAGHQFANIDLVVDDENVSAHAFVPFTCRAAESAVLLPVSDLSSLMGGGPVSTNQSLIRAPRAPSGRSSNSMPPPWSSRILPTMARPSPVPPSRVVM
jgi:hypothetical protein